MARCPWKTAAAALIFLLVVPAWGEQQYLYSPKPAGPEEQSQGKDGILVREVPVEKGDTLSGISRRFSGHGSYYPQILLFNDVKDPNLIYAGSTLRVPVGKGREAGTSEAVPAPSTGKKAGRHTRMKKVSRPVQAAPSAVVPSRRKQQPVTGKAHSGYDSMELSPSDLKRLEVGREKKTAVRKKTAPEGHKRAAGGGEKVKQPFGGERVTKSAPAAPVPAATGEEASQKLFAQAVKAYRQDDFRSALDLFDRFLTMNPGSSLAADASLYKAECYLKLSNQ
ncbi:LysM peptidoglycan-binding domain-containing protein [Geobacter sp. AOG2]|uniref:LysM peptidoglycan-binding domain-containing protein n=1 Tax=Geobacter sp. AOG2 TaxID=1566347 RepID=UPI001CC42259|nr:LysM peptidoglycan-binding domain-containing protein [Geobacter sp. AOG2]GFE62329.1 peptidoglycan-binding protein LysM [Geobacter sp. AOG2]